MLWRKYLAPLVAAFALGFSLYCFMDSAVQVRKLAAQNHDLEAQIARVAERNSDLAARIEQIKTSPAVTERLIRQELGWVRAGELVYRFR